VTAAGGLPTGGGFGGGRGMGMGGGRQGGGQGGGAQGAAAPAPESITLADIKVGDTVMSTGSLKNGNFTALKMGVAEPVAPGAGRRGGADGQAAPAGSSTPTPAAPPQ